MKQEFFMESKICTGFYYKNWTVGISSANFGPMLMKKLSNTFLIHFSLKITLTVMHGKNEW